MQITWKTAAIAVAVVAVGTVVGIKLNETLAKAKTAPLAPAGK